MQEFYHKFYTQYLSCDFEMLVFGSSGFPVILFPTSLGRYYEAKDHGLIHTAERLIDEEKIKIYCPDGLDARSWYNYSIHPADRLKTHMAYERAILNDIVEFAKFDCGTKDVAVAGCSMGGYHALNIAFKHPDKVNSLISISGEYDIHQFIFGYYDDNCYFNNPPDYMPNLTDSWYLDQIKKMLIILGTGEWDESREDSEEMSAILSAKEIPHTLDVRPNSWHDWDSWKKMFPDYLAMILGNSEK